MIQSKIKHNILFVLLSIIIFFGIFSAAAHAEVSSDTETGAPFFSTGIGDADSLLSSGMVEAGDPESHADADGGPSCFDIGSNGYIYILDTYSEGSPIKVFSPEGKYMRSIPSHIFSGAQGIFSMIIHNDTLYALTYNYTICEYDIATNTVTAEYYVPQSVVGTSFRCMINVDRCIAFLSYDRNAATWIFDTETHEFSPADSTLCKSYDSSSSCFIIRFGKNTFSVPAESSNVSVTPLGIDDRNNLIVEYTHDETSYRTYSAQGLLQGYAEKPHTKQALYLGDSVRVSCGKLISARCSKSTYELHKTVFSKYKIDSDEIEALLQRKLRDNDSEKYAVASVTEPYDEPDFSRDEVIAIAREMLNMTWTVMHNDNVTDSDDGLIQVPAIFRGDNLRGVSIGTEFIGIPYCWGGMNGVYSSGSSERMQPFTERIASKSRAGNIYCEGKYKSGSAGVDCSGYTSICYGLTEKRSSRWFCSSYGHLLSSYTDLKRGDYLAKDGHVMLVVDPPTHEDSTIRVLESTKNKVAGIRSNGTVEAVVDFDYYSAFLPITPWHSWYRDGSVIKCAFEGCGQVLGLCGDANKNGSVNTGDATIVMRYCIAISQLSKAETLLADMNGDGKVNTSDAVEILRYTANHFN